MKLRRLPDDFGVVEQLSPDTLAAMRPPGEAPVPSRGSTPVAIYALTKRQLTTPEASIMLARALKLKPGAVEHAGLKDKHAVTTQHVSVRWSGAIATAPRTLTSDRAGAWSATLVGWLDRPLRAADIHRNHFTIVVRSLDQRECDLLEARAELLHDDGECWLANYFGDQRFGSARHAQGFAGVALCHADFMGAFRLLAGTPARKDTGRRRDTTRLIASAWGLPGAPSASVPTATTWAAIAAKLPPSPERRAVERLARDDDALAALAELPQADLTMAVEAFQSVLWNHTLNALVLDAAPPAARLNVETDFGACAFPTHEPNLARWTDNARALRSLVLPMPTSSTELSPPWNSHLIAAAAAFDLRTDQLRIEQMRRPRFGEALRPAFVQVHQLTFAPPAQDELAPARSAKPYRRTLTFSLPRGSYATVLMRALGSD